jgi:hypothetical protein
MPISPVPAIPVQFARVCQSATGIIVFSQLVIATSDDTGKLIAYAESLFVALDRTQIPLLPSVFFASSDLPLEHVV